MNKNIKKNVYKRFKQEIAISNFEKEMKNEKANFIFLLGGYNMKKKVIATVCGCLIVISGVVFATNSEKIINHFRGLGNGVESAAESGYIENPEMDFVNSTGVANNNEKIVENIDVDVKVDNFLMDNTNLSTQFVFKFDDKINEVINFEDIDNIELKDLIILDEEDRIIYSGNDKDRFEEFCKENNLTYTFAEYNESYLNCGLNNFINYTSSENKSINLMYNMYTDEFPKSKKLKFNFTQIVISGENGDSKINIKGEWNFNIDVPEKMYNRSEEYYKVVNCDNKNFKVYSAVLTDTGFEIGVIINGLERPNILTVEEIDKLKTLNNDLENGAITQEEADDLMNKYKEFKTNNTPVNIIDNGDGKVSYIENNNGEKFECALSPSRKSNLEWIDNNNYNFYETFSMNKSTATDKIKVVLYSYGEPVTIELEK